MELHAKLNESIPLVVEGAILCCSLKKRKVIKRLFRAPWDGQELQQLSRDIDDMCKMLLLQISNSALKRVQGNLVVNSLTVPTLNNDAVGIKEQIEGVYGVFVGLARPPWLKKPHLF